MRKEIQNLEKVVWVSDSISCLGKGFTEANLFAEKGSLSKLACLFCNKTNYLAHKSRIVLRPGARENIVMEKKLCFIGQNRLF